MKTTIKIVPTTHLGIVKFELNIFLTKTRSYEFHNIDEAKKSPLAQQLFHLPFVKTIFISQNFIAIEKYDIVEWKDVQEEVAVSILKYLDSGQEVIIEKKEESNLPVSVYAESTPNPSVMKFIANRILVQENFEFKNIEDAKTSPLAQKLFNFPFVKEVFIQKNFISIHKYPVIEWEDITMEIREFIKRYIDSGKPILDEETESKNQQNSHPKEQLLTDFERELVAILDEYVAPAVATDGGYISLDSFDPSSKTVKVLLQGACSGCPSSTATLKNGIENLLKQLLPNQINKVEAING